MSTIPPSPPTSYVVPLQDISSMTSRSGAQDGWRKCAGWVAVSLFQKQRWQGDSGGKGFLDDELDRRRGHEVVVSSSSSSRRARTMALTSLMIQGPATAPVTVTNTASVPRSPGHRARDEHMNVTEQESTKKAMVHLYLSLGEAGSISASTENGDIGEGDELAVFQALDRKQHERFKKLVFAPKSAADRSNRWALEFQPSGQND
ncbi:hypothetical protein EDD85DRAFT_792802 [Armillaria nabsnona]|nr:hypothetical protein EDD85DRAFT_792802 [Armillaria nabsnona]